MQKMTDTMRKTEMSLHDALKIAHKLIKEKAYDKALILLEEIHTQKPNNPETNYLFGLLFYEKSLIDSTIPYLKKSIASSENYLPAHVLLFNCYMKLEQTDNAFNTLEKICTLKDAAPELHMHFLELCYKNKHYAKGKAHGEKLAKTIKTNKNLYNILGLLYRDSGDYDTAADYFSKAYALDNSFLEPMHNMVHIFKQTREHQQAIKNLTLCLKLYPAYWQSYIDLTHIYIATNMLNKAIETMHKGYELAPDEPEIIATYVQAARYACDWQRIKWLTPKLNTITQNAINQNKLVPERPWLNVTRTQNNVVNLSVAKNATEIYLNPKIKNLRPQFAFNKNISGKIRLGFLSGDFYNHPTTHLLGHLFGLLDKSTFHISALSFSTVKENCFYKNMIKSEVDNFIQLNHNGFEAIAKQIAAEKIDILIDMKGYTHGAYIEVCALKPAPLLVQFLGYPGTMGNPQYDYIITDHIITPLSDAKYYTEKFAAMPHTYQVTDNTQAIAKKQFKRSDFGLPENAIVLGMFNNSFKVEENCFCIWLDILKTVDNTVLWIYEANNFIKNQLLDYAKQYNATQDKIFFTENLKKPEHLRRLSLADLILDTFTCNGHTTTTDALWAGVPVITLQGNHFCSRVSSSLLSAINLPELITQSENEYKSLIINYCKHPDKLQQIKAKLAINRNTTPLFDSQQYAKDFGTLMFQIYQRYLDDLPPAHIDTCS